jgi:hypothetical protein
MIQNQILLALDSFQNIGVQLIGRITNKIQVRSFLERKVLPTDPIVVWGLKPAGLLHSKKNVNHVCR